MAESQIQTQTSQIIKKEKKEELETSLQAARIEYKQFLYGIKITNCSIEFLSISDNSTIRVKCGKNKKMEILQSQYSTIIKIGNKTITLPKTLIQYIREQKELLVYLYL